MANKFISIMILCFYVDFVLVLLCIYLPNVNYMCVLYNIDQIYLLHNGFLACANVELYNLKFCIVVNGKTLWA